jgi:hypothetical protein
MARWRQVDRPDAIPGRPQRVFGDGQRNSRLLMPPAPTTYMSRVTELDGQIDLRSAASHNRETLVFTQN